jgi:hypothetical protein
MQSLGPRAGATSANVGMSGEPDHPQSDADTEREADEADTANGGGSAVNDTEARYGPDESPA